MEPAVREAVESLVGEGLLIRGGVRGLAAMKALLLSWRRRGDYGLGDDAAVDEALRLATDPSYARLASGEATVAGRPVSVAVKTTKRGDRVLVIRFRSGFSVIYEPPEDFWDKPVRERHRIVYDFLVVRAVERRGRWYAEAVKPLRVKGDPEALKRALDIVAPLADAYGMEPLAVLSVLWLTRAPPGPGAVLVALRSAFMAIGDDERPVHAAEVSTLGTLKSTVAALFEAYGDAWRLTEWPTVATLFGDARTGTTRLEATRLVVFDEFTKWRRKTSDSYDIWSGVANGMATCTWRRAAGGAKAPGVDKCVSTMWLGNPEAVRPVTGDSVVPPGEHVRKWLAETAGMDGENLRSIMSRLSVYGGYLGDDEARRLVAGLHGYVPRPGLFRAWMEEARRAAWMTEPEPPPSLEGDARVVERYRAAAAAARVVFGGDEDRVETYAAEAARHLLVIR